jgi:hypothetical protein
VIKQFKITLNLHFLYFFFAFLVLLSKFFFCYLEFVFLAKLMVTR